METVCDKWLTYFQLYSKRAPFRGMRGKKSLFDDYLWDDEDEAMNTELVNELRQVEKRAYTNEDVRKFCYYCFLESRTFK